MFGVNLVLRAKVGYLVATFITTAVTDAAAFTILGITIGEEEESTQVEIIDPLPYQVQVNVAGNEDAVADALQGGSSLWADRETPASGAAGLISKAQDDYRSLLGVLYQRGYYSGAISITINGQEAANLPLTRDLNGPAQVVVRVDPGPQFLFGDVGFVSPAPAGFGPPLGNTATAQEVFISGARARADVIAQVGEEEVEKWRYAGHPKASVADREVIADHQANTVAQFGPVTVTGDTGGVDPEFVRYMANIPGGGVFDPEAVEIATDRLTNLAVFRAVRIVEAENVQPDGRLPLSIETTPRAPRRIGFGATLSSTEGLGLEGFWLHRQAGRRAQRLRFDFSLSGIGTEGGFEDYDYVFSTSYTTPGFLDPDNALIAGFTARHLVFDDYTEDAVEVRLGIERRFNEKFTGRVFGEVKFSEVEDSDGTENFLTFALPISGEYDARDVPLDAREGFYVSGEIQPFYEAEFETLALRTLLEGRTYYELFEDQTVLALRVRAGTVFGGDRDEISPDELFFSGGGGSVRGYEYRANGIEIDGETEGGRSLLEVSAEVRQRLTDSFELVAFADGGIVGTDVVPGVDGDLRIGAGAGIRYDTSLGPLRLDVAVPINPEEDDPSFALYIGIGQAF